jgi:hypothetical protein
MELTAHFTARTDDNHAAPVLKLYYYTFSPTKVSDPVQIQSTDPTYRLTCTVGIQTSMQEMVRLCAVYRIKPHAPPLVQASVNSFEFQPCGRTSQAECFTR